MASWYSWKFTLKPQRLLSLWCLHKIPTFPCIACCANCMHIHQLCRINFSCVQVAMGGCPCTIQTFPPSLHVLSLSLSLSCCFLCRSTWPVWALSTVTLPVVMSSFPKTNCWRSLILACLAKSRFVPTHFKTLHTQPSFNVLTFSIPLRGGMLSISPNF